MINLTVRNIPDNIINKIKTLSKIDRRSINSEILVILEKGLSSIITTKNQNKISKETQVKIWQELSGKWEDSRTTKEIINNIISSRTLGRKVKL